MPLYSLNSSPCGLRMTSTQFQPLHIFHSHNYELLPMFVRVQNWDVGADPRVCPAWIENLHPTRADTWVCPYDSFSTAFLNVLPTYYALYFANHKV